MSSSRSQRRLSCSTRLISHGSTSDARTDKEMQVQSPDWIPGHESLFKTPKSWSPIKARRKTTLLKTEVEFSGNPTPSKRGSKRSVTAEDFQVPKLMFSSPPGVMTRSRRSSIYVAKTKVTKQETQCIRGQSKTGSNVKLQKKSMPSVKRAGRQSSAKKDTNQVTSEKVLLSLNDAFNPLDSISQGKNNISPNVKSSVKCQSSRRKCGKDTSSVDLVDSPLSKSNKISFNGKAKGSSLLTNVDQRNICESRDLFKFTCIKSTEGEIATPKRDSQKLSENYKTDISLKINSPKMVEIPGEMIVETLRFTPQRKSPQNKRRHSSVNRKIYSLKKEKSQDQTESSPSDEIEKIVGVSRNDSPVKKDLLTQNREATSVKAKTPKREKKAISKAIEHTPSGRILKHKSKQNPQEEVISVTKRHRSSGVIKKTPNKSPVVDENTTKLFTPLNQIELSTRLRRTVDKYVPSLIEISCPAGGDWLSGQTSSSRQIENEEICMEKTSEFFLEETKNINKNTCENLLSTHLQSKREADESLSPLQNIAHSMKEAAFEESSNSFPQAQHSMTIGVNNVEAGDKSRHVKTDNREDHNMLMTTSNDSQQAECLYADEDKNESFELYDPNVSLTHSNHSQRCTIL